MLESPDALDKHIRRTSASATMSILYDYPTLESENDKAITKINTFVEHLSAAGIPGAHLVEMFPWMIHIPERYIILLVSYRLSNWDARFAKWKREAMERFRQHSAMFHGLLDTVSNDIVSSYFHCTGYFRVAALPGQGV
jgi:predicted small metal-binding protein